MRKRTVKTMANTIFWYVLYFMPVISYLLYLFIHPGSTATVMAVDFMEFINACGFGALTDNVIYTSLYDVFGTGGLMPFFDSPVIFTIMTWFVGVFFIHLFVDFLLLLPRLLQKAFRHVGGDD